MGTIEVDSSRTERPDAASAERRLHLAAALFAVAVLVHNGDHLRRGGDSVSAGVFWLGSAAIIVEVGVVVLVMARHPAAPLAATTIGFGLALGYVLVHFTPQHGFLSDSFVSGDRSPVSITAALLETVTGAGMAVLGLGLLRHQGLAAARRPAENGSLAGALRHPLVAMLAAGNIVIFLGSLATR